MFVRTSHPFNFKSTPALHVSDASSFLNEAELASAERDRKRSLHRGVRVVHLHQNPGFETTCIFSFGDSEDRKQSSAAGHGVEADAASKPSHAANIIAFLQR